MPAPRKGSGRAYSFAHDREHEDLHKMPRKGMWNWHSGKLNIRCPDCGNVSFVDNHEKVGDYLNPSVVCPHVGCGFHTQPTELQGYRYASNVDGE